MLDKPPQDLTGEMPVWRQYLPSLLVFLLVGLVCVLVDRQESYLAQQQEREQIRLQLDMLSARTETVIDAPVRAARGLVATLSSAPDMSQAHFSWLASRITNDIASIRNVAGARDLVVTLIHPVAGNEASLGLDYGTTPAQRDAVNHVRDTGEFILAGPLDLVQGGKGLVARFPVFSDIDGARDFWGILSVELDLPTVFAQSGLSAPDMTLDIAVIGEDGRGRFGNLFLGEIGILSDQPVSDSILFPNGSWEIYARPIGGWGSTYSMLAHRIYWAFAAALVMGLVLISNVLAIERKSTISTLRQREAQLLAARAEVESLANHDPLTGLPNRRMLDQKLADLKGADYLGMIMLDLDGFKEINDSYGHAVGDDLLIRVAARLRRAVDANSLLLRSGGDEFVVIVSKGPQDDVTPELVRRRLEDTARKIINIMKVRILAGGQKCQIGISAGVHPHDSSQGMLPEEELLAADQAMYEAKQSGRNRFMFSSAQRPHRCFGGLAPSDLLDALTSEQIVPFYQPQFAADGTTLVGLEALARWQLPNGLLVMPDEFIGLAHALKVENDIDARILQQATRDLKHWDRMSLHVPKVSVNASFRRLNDPDLIESMDSLGADPKRINLELLESISLDEPCSQITRNLTELKARGFRIEIDDFGTGYSSISSLLKLRPDQLKIDRSLVQAATSTRANKRLLASIAEMGHALQIQVCAEGIETQAQFDLARLVGCTVFQGFYLAHPMSFEDLTQLLQQKVQDQVQLRSVAS